MLPIDARCLGIGVKASCLLKRYDVGKGLMGYHETAIYETLLSSYILTLQPIISIRNNFKSQMKSIY
jgi:hypothetical protein